LNRKTNPGPCFGKSDEDHAVTRVRDVKAHTLVPRGVVLIISSHGSRYLATRRLRFEANAWIARLLRGPAACCPVTAGLRTGPRRPRPAPCGPDSRSRRQSFAVEGLEAEGDPQPSSQPGARQRESRLRSLDREVQRGEAAPGPGRLCVYQNVVVTVVEVVVVDVSVSVVVALAASRAAPPAALQPAVRGRRRDKIAWSGVSVRADSGGHARDRYVHDLHTLCHTRRAHGLEHVQRRTMRNAAPTGM